MLVLPGTQALVASKEVLLRLARLFRCQTTPVLCRWCLLQHSLWPPLLSACARFPHRVLCLQPPLLCLWPPLLLLHLCLLVLHLRLPLLEVRLEKMSLTCVIEGVPRVW